ncbi:MAG TPA: pirin family protein [Candidatus Competibacteraceae bacterium]|nr:pirin family protein [Candidatus Competibacteraceae bacterium]
MNTAIELIIEPRARDLGGFSVRRVLPYVRRRHVGPFVFLDHMGPLRFAPGQGVDVRPHPHIGLATVTYLFEGELVHRDSLGYVQSIRPGDVNWMTAGCGIVHSERSAPEQRTAGARLHGIQSWVALPRAEEECKPSFHHHPAATLPSFEESGARLTLIAGTAYGRQAPVAVRSPLFYLDARLSAGAALALPAEYAERAVYVAEGEVTVAGQPLAAGRMAVLAPGGGASVCATAPARIMLLGGEALDGERIIWWNFVASSKARIEQAKRDWAEERFPPVPGESERIPLPER